MNKSYYAIIPANVRYDSRLTANAKLLYGEITALCNEKGYCWARNSYFSELYGVSKTSISKWISQLIEYGYIFSEIKYREGTKEIENRYLKLVKDPINESSIPIEEKLKGSLRNVKNPIEEKLKDNNTSNTTSNNTNNRKESKKEKKSEKVAQGAQKKEKSSKKNDTKKEKTSKTRDTEVTKHPKPKSKDITDEEREKLLEEGLNMLNGSNGNTSGHTAANGQVESKKENKTTSQKATEDEPLDFWKYLYMIGIAVVFVYGTYLGVKKDQ